MCCQGQLWAVAGIQEEDTSVHVHTVVSAMATQVKYHISNIIRSI